MKTILLTIPLLTHTFIVHSPAVLFRFAGPVLAGCCPLQWDLYSTAVVNHLLLGETDVLSDTTLSGVGRRVIDRNRFSI